MDNWYIVIDPIFLAWIAWMLVWLAAWAWSKRARRHEGWSNLWHTLPFMLAVMLIAGYDLQLPVLRRPVVPYLQSFHVIGLVLTVSGLAFSVWARFFLGRNWSASVQVKDDHQLVRSGPYRLVRHPIYTGILVAFAGTALAQDRWRSVLAVVLMVAGLVLKLRVEERFMTETFGDAYRDYRRRTKALLPFVY